MDRKQELEKELVAEIKEIQKELIRKDSSFTMGEETVFIRKFSMLDMEWLDRQGLTNVPGLIEMNDIKNLARIIYHQMPDADKIRYKAKTITSVNEDGEEEEIKLSGPMVFLAEFDSSKVSEWDDALISLLEAYGMSQPVIEKLNSIENKYKKKIRLAKAEDLKDQNKSQSIGA